MKHLLLLPWLGLLLPTVSQAQTAAPIRFGVTAGGTLTTLVGHGIVSEPTVKSLAGVVGGVFVQLPLLTSGHLFLQPELVYNQEGYRLSHPSTNYTATLRSSYVSLPLLLGFTTHGLFVTAGPQIGYLAGVHEHYEFEVSTPSGGILGPVESTNTNASPYRRWETSLAAAVGYRLGNGLGLEVRYTEALNSREGGNVFGEDTNPRNAGGQLRLSYLLP
jgi:hypothetical protein